MTKKRALGRDPLSWIRDTTHDESDEQAQGAGPERTGKTVNEPSASSDQAPEMLDETPQSTTPPSKTPTAPVDEIPEGKETRVLDESTSAPAPSAPEPGTAPPGSSPGPHRPQRADTTPIGTPTASPQKGEAGRQHIQWPGRNPPSLVELGHQQQTTKKSADTFWGTFMIYMNMLLFGILIGAVILMFVRTDIRKNTRKIQQLEMKLQQMEKALGQTSANLQAPSSTTGQP